MSKKTPLKTIIDHVGSQGKLAQALNIRTGHQYTQSHVSYWSRTDFVPPEIARDLEVLSQGRVTRYELCPSVFGKNFLAALKDNDRFLEKSKKI